MKSGLFRGARRPNSDEESRHLVGKSTFARRCVNTPTLQSNTPVCVSTVLQIVGGDGGVSHGVLSCICLGNPPTCAEAMLSRLSHPYRQCSAIPQTGEMKSAPSSLSLNGKGREKSLRLYKGALPLLHWLHPSAYEYYMESFWNHHFPGDCCPP